MLYTPREGGLLTFTQSPMLALATMANYAISNTVSGDKLSGTMALIVSSIVKADKHEDTTP